MFSDVFLDFSVTLMKSPVAGGLSTLVLLTPCQWFPFDVFFVLLVIILLDVADLSVLVLVFCGEAPCRPSRFISSTSCAALSYLLLWASFFVDCLSRHSPPEYRDWKKISPLDCNDAPLSTKVSFRAFQLWPLTFYFCPLHLSGTDA